VPICRISKAAEDGTERIFLVENVFPRINIRIAVCNTA
jgi:hypothetical protein